MIFKMPTGTQGPIHTYNERYLQTQPLKDTHNYLKTLQFRYWKQNWLQKNPLGMAWKVRRGTQGTDLPRPTYNDGDKSS